MLLSKQAAVCNSPAFFIHVILGLVVSVALQAADNLPTFSRNSDGVTNTRHNMALSNLVRPPDITFSGNTMDAYRNDYGEVCVYCHTPHGANKHIDAPLWNRTFNNNTYTTYLALGSSSVDGTIGQPGASSLMCLSCHDGTLPVDSVINMPGSGKYLSSQQTEVSLTFLQEKWDNTEFGLSPAVAHLGLNETECLACHSPGTEIYKLGATDFRAAALGTDLSDDHPVGVQLPLNQLGTEFVDPTGSRTGIRYYDNNGDNTPQTNEIRYYITGNGPEVECASCHDPHGVWNGARTKENYNPTFLRVNNDNSAVCYTCHIK